jgi:hypothetical protein
MLGCKIIYGTVTALFFICYIYGVFHDTSRFVAPVGAQKYEGKPAGK